MTQTKRPPENPARFNIPDVIPLIFSLCVGRIADSLSGIRLCIIIDSADEIEAADPVSERNLHVLTEVMSHCAGIAATAIIGIRGDGAGWRNCHKGKLDYGNWSRVGSLPREKVVQSWLQAGLLESQIQTILSTSSSCRGAEIVAGELSDLWVRHFAGR